MADFLDCSVRAAWFFFQPVICWYVLKRHDAFCVGFSTFLGTLVPAAFQHCCVMWIDVDPPPSSPPPQFLLTPCRILRAAASALMATPTQPFIFPSTSRRLLLSPRLLSLWSVTSPTVPGCFSGSVNVVYWQRGGGAFISWCLHLWPFSKHAVIPSLWPHPRDRRTAGRFLT